MASWQGGLGAFLQSFTKGMEANEERRTKQELLKLQQKKLDLEGKESELKIKDMLTKASRQEKQDALAGEYVRSGQQQQAFEGFEPPAEETSLLNPNRPPPRSQGSLLDELIIGAGHPERLLQNKSEPGRGNRVVGQGASLRGPSGEELYTNPAVAKEGVSDRAGLWARYKNENPNASSEQLLRGWNPYLEAMGFAGTRGRESGELEVRSSPKALETKTKESEASTKGKPLPEGQANAITQLRSLIQRLDIVDPEKPKEKGGIYSDAFIGPARNIGARAQEKFGETPGIGRLVGGPISTNEAAFRQAVEGMNNVIANIRGGLVLPPFEMERVEKEAALLRESPTAFKARYKGFREYVEGLLRDRIKMAGTTRENVGSLGQEIPSPPSGWMRK